MKKILLLVIFISMLAVGCNKQSGSENVKPNLNAEASNNSTIEQQNKSDQKTIVSTGKNISIQDIPTTWKTYNAKTLKYRFQYPADWYFNVNEEIESDPHLSNIKNISDRPQPGQVTIEIQAGQKKDANTDLLAAFKDYTGYDVNGGCLCASGKISALKINGNSAFLVEYAGGEGPSGPGYFIERSKTEFFYILVYGTSEATTVEKIVSSLQFIN